MCEHPPRVVRERERLALGPPVCLPDRDLHNEDVLVRGERCSDARVICLRPIVPPLAVDDVGQEEHVQVRAGVLRLQNVARVDERVPDAYEVKVLLF